MRDAIIQYSILGLQKDGLRFSIDEVAQALKISKKTIYKYFATKQELAIEIYKTYYENALRVIRETGNLQTKDNAKKILAVYYQSCCMIRDEIFNKYALNASIRILAQVNHNRIKSHIEDLMSDADKAALTVIIDGALRMLCEFRKEEAGVIDKLAGLIC